MSSSDRTRGRRSHHHHPTHPRSNEPHARQSSSSYQVARPIHHDQPARRLPQRSQFQQSSLTSDRHTPQGCIRLITNAYKITTNNKVNILVHEYGLQVECSKECSDLPPKVLCKAFVSRSVRKLLMDSIVPNILDAKSKHKNSVLIDPNLDNIFTLDKFNIPEASDECHMGEGPVEQIKFSELDVPTDLISNLKVDICITYLKSLSLNTDSYPTSLISSMVHHQLLNDMLRYESVYYLADDRPELMMNRLDLISRHLMGISISGARRSNDNQTVVIINCSHSYITQAHRLIDLIASYVQGAPVHGVKLYHDPEKDQSIIRGARLHNIYKLLDDEQEFQAFCSILSGFKCRSKDFEGNNINLRFNVTTLGAKDLYVDDRTTVYDYYRSRGILLNYDRLPCLLSRSTKHPYHPFELCTLMPGQKVPVFRLSTKARQHLIGLNKPQPEISWTKSVEARNVIASKTAQNLGVYGVELSSSPAEASGSTLIRPVLQYQDRSLFPPNDYWESSRFLQSIDLVGNWALIDTVGLDSRDVDAFFRPFSQYATKFGFHMEPPSTKLLVPKADIIERRTSIEQIIAKCSKVTPKKLRFIMFIIDTNSTPINRLIHLSFDENPNVTATCIRSESILNTRQHRAINRTLVHKLNSRLGGTNMAFNEATWNRIGMNYNDLMIVGLDVTHPDNELSGVSIVGCAYTFSSDLFRHKSLVWPQAARKEIITKMDTLVDKLLKEYKAENDNRLPNHIVVYRDGVSNEEFERVRSLEINKALRVIEQSVKSTGAPKPNLSYIIAQKRHTMRFFVKRDQCYVHNPPGGTLIDQGIVVQENREFYLYSNTSPQATARPLHYHVLLNGLGLENLQKLTYYLCFNFGKCSGSLSMPSSLRYAHNAAYDARNRVIAAREFHENKFYTTKFFC